MAVVFTCNRAYFSKFLQTASQLVTNGKYTGPICLVIGDDLIDSDEIKHPFITEYSVIIKHFPDIYLPPEFLKIAKQLRRPAHWIKKLFQFHKLNIFNTWFKQWDYIYYLDCGISIYSDITPFLNCRVPGKLVAHSDAYPTYVWKLYTQFDQTNSCWKELSEKYSMTNDYFQTTIMLIDTNIITESTFSEIYDLVVKYPISITNDQGIIALYFTQIHPLFQQIRVKGDADNEYYYDYLRRSPTFKYILLKCG